MSPKPTITGRFHGTHKFVFLGDPYELEKPSPRHEVYIMLSRPATPQALTSQELTEMSGRDATQIKRMLMSGIGKRFKDKNGLPAPLDTWLESITVEDLVLGIVRPDEEEGTPQVLMRATLTAVLRDESDILPGRSLDDWLRLKECTASFSIDYPEQRLLDRLVRKALDGYLTANTDRLLHKAAVTSIRQINAKLDQGESLTASDLNMLRNALDGAVRPVQSGSGVFETVSPEMGSQLVGAAPFSLLNLPPSIDELIFEVQKLSELGLDREAVEVELIVELEATLPNLPDANSSAPQIRKLKDAAHLIVTNARNFEALDEKDVRTVDRALKPFAQNRVVIRAKVVGSALRLLMDMTKGTNDPAKNTVPVLATGLINAIKKEGLEQEKDGKMKQLLAIAGKIQNQAPKTTQTRRKNLIKELKNLLEGIRKYEPVPIEPVDAAVTPEQKTPPGKSESEPVKTVTPPANNTVPDPVSTTEETSNPPPNEGVAENASESVESSEILEEASEKPDPDDMVIMDEQESIPVQPTGDEAIDPETLDDPEESDDEEYIDL